MKKILSLAVLSVLLVFSAAAQNASCHFGIQGGVSLNKYTTFEEIRSNLTGWHAGVSLLVKLPAFFALQPAVQFERSNSKLPSGSGEDRLKVNTLNIPVAVQWGPDLGFCRVFVEVAPFMDINLGAKLRDVNVKERISNAQFGMGTGLGLDVWRMQIKARYNWALNGEKQGLTITLAYLFN